MADRARLDSPARRAALKAGFRSGLEKTIAADLSLREVDFVYEPERFTYTVSHQYTPDFRIIPRTLPPFYLEAKGYFPGEDRRKILAALVCHPKLDLRLLLQTPHRRIAPGAKMTYATWCDSISIRWCTGRVPEEWLG